MTYAARLGRVRFGASGVGLRFGVDSSSSSSSPSVEKRARLAALSGLCSENNDNETHLDARFPLAFLEGGEPGRLSPSVVALIMLSDRLEDIISLSPRGQDSGLPFATLLRRIDFNVFIIVQGDDAIQPFE